MRILSPRFSFPPWMLATVIALAQFVSTVPAHAQSEHKQVLVLYSTRRDAQFSIVGESELPRLLDVALNRNIDYYAEFIDITRFPVPAYRKAFSDFLRLKYQGVRFDVVIALQDAALEFVNDLGNPLFRDTPVVFLTNRSRTRPRPNTTGLVQERNYVATVDLIRQLQPDVREVFIVSGAGVGDEDFENLIRNQLQSYDSGVTFTYFSGLATRELEDRLSRLPPRSAVYHLLVTEDRDGNKFHPLEYVDRVAAAANAPTYCWVDSAMDHGIVGGSLYSQSETIRRVGQLAVRVLQGEAVENIPVATVNPQANQVDWRQLQRWGIDEARVPPGTTVRFREPTIWDRYKTYILGALALLISQTVLITGLLILRKRRQRAEEELRANQIELRKSYERNRDLGARLLKAQETERSRIAGELHDDICQRMLLLTIELEAMGRPESGEPPAAEALKLAQEIATSLHQLSHRLHPTRLRLIGLVGALERLCLELSRAGFAVSCTHDNVPATLPPDVMLCSFRIVQEALQNAIKYSGAHELSVHIAGESDRLTVSIKDNGSGFNVHDAWGNGVGLVTMVERAEALGGSMDIRSSPGAGTQLTATIPLQVVEKISA